MPDTPRDPDDGATRLVALYSFKTAKSTYAIDVEHDPGDRFDPFRASVSSANYSDVCCDNDIRGAVGVAVMRIIRHETGNNCMCSACRETHLAPTAAPDAHDAGEVGE